MKIKLLIGGDTRESRAQAHNATLPYAGCDHVVVDIPCPSCKREAPTKLRGRNQYHDHATHHATAVALCCGVAVGKLEVKVDTIFGIEEDRRVARGPWRVY